MKTFRRLLGFLRPYRRGVWGSMLLACAAMGGTTLIPYLIGESIDRIGKGDKATLELLAVVILATTVLRLALTVARRLVAGKVSLGVEFDLRERLYNHLQALELGFFDREQTGQLMSRVTVDLQAVRFFLGYGLVFITQSALTLILAATAMFILNPLLAAISLWPVPLVVFVAQRYGMQARPMLQAVQQRLAELTADAEESVSGVRVVKAFAREAQQERHFKRTVNRVFDQSIRSTRLRAFYNPLIGFLPSMGLALILIVGGREVIAGTLSIGDFTAFYTYLLMLLAPMRQLGMALGMSQRATASGTRIFELLDREPQIVAGTEPLATGPGEVRFEGVSLLYEGQNEPALQGIDLTLKAGTTVALVGASGSGKTSLAALIPRLYDPTAGRVSIDGTDIRQVENHSLKQAVAVVSDDPFLFSSSIAENISYARPEATRDEIEAAGKAAHADEFIQELADGYDTVVGERGLTLSGGQRQRIALARALICHPRVLILDDATSSVDPSTERSIKEALADAAQDPTTVVIAHRYSTIELADEIVVLSDGRLEDQGTHHDLLERSDHYREIVERGMPDRVFLVRRDPEHVEFSQQ